MEKIGEGSQAIVYKLDENWIFSHYKIDTQNPIDFSTLEIMVNQVEELKRIVIPVKADYNNDKTKIVGTYSRYISGVNFNSTDITSFSNIPCEMLYSWYKDFIEDVKILSKYKILALDITSDNILINNNGPFLIDAGGFKYSPEKDNEEIEKENIANINYCFLYGIVWKVGQFVSRQSLDEIFEEIRNFNGTLREYLQFKNPYEYGNLDADSSVKK